MRDWDVRTTSMGLGNFPWWSTKFLWFQIDQRMVKVDCRKLIPFCSMGLLERIQSNIHCLVELWSKLEVLISSIEPCQTTLANGHCRKRWVMVSSSSLHMRHLLEAGIPMLFKIAKKRRLSCRIFQMKVRIFKVSFTFQINHQIAWGILDDLWFSMEVELWFWWRRE